MFNTWLTESGQERGRYLDVDIFFDTHLVTRHTWYNFDHWTNVPIYSHFNCQILPLGQCPHASNYNVALASFLDIHCSAVKFEEEWSNNQLDFQNKACMWNICTKYSWLDRNIYLNNLDSLCKLLLVSHKTQTVVSSIFWLSLSLYYIAWRWWH